MSTLNLTAHDSGYALLVEETQYRYLVTSDGKPFSYFLNPAVFGSATALVQWDDLAQEWTQEEVSPLAHLDDRYGVGAGYVANFYGKQPMGSNLPGVFIKLDSNEEHTAADVSGLRLQKAYTGGTIVPYLIVQVYEQRLASYEYYAYLGKPIGAANALEYLGQTREELRDTLAYELALELSPADPGDPLSTDGSLFAAYKEFTGLELKVEFLDEGVISVRNMSRFDNHEVRGERAGEITTGHLNRPTIVLPGLTKVVGHDHHGFKPMQGRYTVFAPEKLNDLTKAVHEAVEALTTLDDAQREALKLQLGYNWNDFFRGQDQAITIKVPDHLANRTVLAADLTAGATTATVKSTYHLADAGVVRIGQELISYTGKTDTTLTGLTRGIQGTTAAAAVTGAPAIQPHKEIRANVFMSVFGSQTIGGTVSIEDPENPGQFLEVANSRSIDLSDSYSHVDEHFHNAYPEAQRFVTGPRGARGIVRDDGTVEWLNDAYNV